MTMKEMKRKKGGLEVGLGRGGWGRQRDRGGEETQREKGNKGRWVGGAQGPAQVPPHGGWGEGRAEMVSTVTAGSWWPGMWAINSAVGRFAPPSPLPLCLLLGWGEILHPHSQLSGTDALTAHHGGQQG